MYTITLKFYLQKPCQLRILKNSVKVEQYLCWLVGTLSVDRKVTETFKFLRQGKDIWFWCEEPHTLSNNIPKSARQINSKTEKRGRGNPQRSLLYSCALAARSSSSGPTRPKGHFMPLSGFFFFKYLKIICLKKPKRLQSCPKTQLVSESQDSGPSLAGFVSAVF